MKKPLVIIAGPTACGKTKTSIELAKKINGEIISADSMQIYKYMDIGTAKITEEEMCGIKHYMIDELLPSEEFNVAVFQKLAKKYIDEILSKGKIPIIVGGTGFYINALIYDNDFAEEDEDKSLRVELEKTAKEKGVTFLHNYLREIDPVSAEKIHENNVKRVIRAIEFYKNTGKRISEHNEFEKLRETPYDLSFFVLNMDRELLYDRINKRVDKMLEDGWLLEVKKLLEMGFPISLTALKALGYKDLIQYLEGEKSYEDAVTNIKTETRHFAKRQLTWFRRQTDAIWIDVDKNTLDETLKIMTDEIKIRSL